MLKKAVFIIVIIGLLSFGNSLFNGFVGDDGFLIRKNSFYKTWKNFPLLFSHKYITDSDELFNSQEGYSISGSVAYRPTLSATFFIDRSLFKTRPFGYHLTNLIFHILNSILVYFLIFKIFKKVPFALLSAVIFTAHPLKSEAVCSIGYRADIVSSFFVLLAFICYLAYSDKKITKNKIFFLFSHVFFLLGVFAKESAAVYPALIMLFDWQIKGEKLSCVIKNLFKRYIGFVSVLGFYLFTYFILFPNKALGSAGFIGSSFSSHIIISLKIFLNYLSCFFFPFLVKLLPPGYLPLEPWGYRISLLFFAFICLIVFIVLNFKRDRKISFASLWFLISFLPVSNIIPLVNPMAYRYMYLPSVGIVILIVVLLEKFSKKLKVEKLLKIGFIIICIGITISLNMAWKNNFVMAHQMIKEFPQSPKGYLFAGFNYFNKGKFDKAETMLVKALQKGGIDPRAYSFIAICNLDDHEKAKQYFKESIRVFPYFGVAYEGMGRINLFEGNLEQAELYFTKSLQIAPRVTAYGYLIQIYLMRQDRAGAEMILNEAERKLTNSKHTYLLPKLFDEEVSKLPIDVGLFAWVQGRRLK